MFYSDKASANILSFASQIDAGASITYNQDNDSFTMIPRSRQTTYTFGRKATTTGESRMYICDTRTMAIPLPNEDAMIQTVDNNKSHYTKADIERADRARHLISVMGFPSVAEAIKRAEGASYQLPRHDSRCISKGRGIGHYERIR